MICIKEFIKSKINIEDNHTTKSTFFAERNLLRLILNSIPRVLILVTAHQHKYRCIIFN